MKTVLLLVILTLVGLESFAQARTDNPVLPRIYEDGYSINQIKEFALGYRSGVSHEYASSYRQKLLSIINEGLIRSGEYVNVNNGNPIEARHIGWIYEHVFRVQNDSLPAGHRNTWKNGSQVSWTSKSQKKYYGPLDHFKYGVCEIKLDKPSCANLVPDYSLMGYVKQTDPEKKSTPESKPKQEEVKKRPIEYGGQKKLVSEAAAADTKEIKVEVDDESWWKGLTKTERRLIRVGVSAVTLAGAYFIIDPFGDKGESVVIVEEKEEEFNPVDALPQAKARLIKQLQTRGLTISFSF